jgi:hypothetical protein
MDDIQRPNSLVAEIAREKHLYAPWHGKRCHIEKVLNFPETSMCVQAESDVYLRHMDDIQMPSSLVAGIERAKHLYAPWCGNCCHVEKVHNFPETSMCVIAESVVYSSSAGPCMIIRGQIHWLQV